MQSRQGYKLSFIYCKKKIDNQCLPCYISVVALESHSYSAGDTITMRLMKRAKV